MIKYVSGVLLMEPDGDYPLRTVMVRKIKPDWQNGLWNFPGGKVNPDEGSDAAIDRELKEELGCRIHSKITDLDYFAEEEGPDYSVSFYRGKLPRILYPQQFPPANDVGEEIRIIPARSMPGDIIGNCRYLSLMAQDWRESFVARIKVKEDVSKRPSW